MKVIYVVVVLALVALSSCSAIPKPGEDHKDRAYDRVRHHTLIENNFEYLSLISHFDNLPVHTMTYYRAGKWGCLVARKNRLGLLRKTVSIDCTYRQP